MAVGDWTRKLLGELEAQRTIEAVMLLPSRTDARWMSELRALPRCYLRGRLSFGGGDGAAPFASVVVYAGENPEAFKEAFKSLGDCYTHWE